MIRDFDDALEKGRKAEDEVARRLRAHGFYVTPLRDLPIENGHGPRVHGRAEELNPPDLRAERFGASVTVEVKWKEHPSLGRLTQEPEHGIDWPHWVSYLEWEERFREPVFLVIAEESSGEFVGARLKSLKVRPDCPTRVRGKWMAYFTRSQFTCDWMVMVERHAARRTWADADKVRAEGLW
jgi:hypothetical protein